MMAMPSIRLRVALSNSASTKTTRKAYPASIAPSSEDSPKMGMLLASLFPTCQLRRMKSEAASVREAYMRQSCRHLGLQQVKCGYV